MSARAGQQVLKQGAKRDPELYILAAVMTGALGLTGWYFGSKPTTASSEKTVVHPAKGGMPWHHDDEEATFKYKYHPYGDEKNEPKEAPSALHAVIIPNVNLPKELHDRWNKFGKE